MSAPTVTVKLGRELAPGDTLAGGVTVTGVLADPTPGRDGQLKVVLWTDARRTVVLGADLPYEVA